jgi:hypothetical protein
MQVIHPNKKTAEVTDGPFVEIDALDFALAYDLATWDCLFVDAGGCENLSIKPDCTLGPTLEKDQVSETDLVKTETAS